MPATKPATPALDALEADKQAIVDYEQNGGPVRPATPTRDALEADIRAVVEYEQQVAAQTEAERFAVAVAKSSAAEVALKQRRRDRKATILQARHDAFDACADLVAALERYVAATELPPYMVKVRVTNFLAKNGLRTWGHIGPPNSTDSLDDLLYELPEAF